MSRSPAEWLRVKELFHQALECAPEQRLAFLATASNGDTVLRVEVERLLTAHAQAGGFIEQSPVAPPATIPDGAADQKPAAGRCSSAGQIRGHYEILTLIGVGGMGEVYAARDIELGRTVALKVVIGDDADAQKALRREAQHASQLNHPHICTIYEVGVWDGQAHIAMEYVEGRQLSELVRAPPAQATQGVGGTGLSIEAVLRYGTQIADALAYAHDHGLIHGDLKGANIVVTPDGRAKVLDFGLARRVPGERLKELSESQASLTPEGMVSGTLSYMAPELLRGGLADARTDIWALGVLLQEMAVGTKPFVGATGFELSGAILHEPPAPLPARIPGSLQQIIRRCLAKNPDERYQAAGEIRSALEEMRPDPPGAVRRAPGRLAVAALLVAIVVAAGLTWRAVRPQTTVAPVGPSGRPAIAVMPFERVGAGQDQDTAWMSSGVPSMLMTGLAQTRGLDIVSAERLLDALKRGGETSLASLDKSQAAEVARQAGAGSVVVGSIFRAGSEIRIDAQLDDLSSGRILAAYSVRGTDLFALVDQLALQIRDGIGFRDAPDMRHIADVSTSSLEAYRLYSMGTDAFNNSRMDQAQKYLEAAVALDPAFADAYQRLSAIMSFRGLTRARQEYLRKAAEHADRLSERRRLLLNVQMARDVNPAEAGRVLDELIAKFPDTAEAYLLASNLYQPRPDRPGDLEKLLRILSASAALMPTTGSVRNNYGYALVDAHRYPEALREFEAYVRLGSREPNPYDSLGEGQLLSGAADKAVESYSRALTMDATFNASRNGRAWSLAALGRYDAAVAEQPYPSVKALILSRVGRYREAEDLIAGGIQQAVRDENIAEHAWLLFASSMLAIERKEYPRALQDIHSAERLLTDLPPGGRAHRLLAELLGATAQMGAGRMGAARDHLDAQRRLGEPPGEVEKWWFRALEGEVALGGGDFQTAAAAFSAGEPSRRMWFSMQRGTVALLANNLTSRDGLARVAWARGDLQGAIQIYRRLLTYGPEQKWVAAFEPRYVLEIARLLEQSGDREAARKEYARFLELWKDADPGLPELADARRGLK